MSVVLLEPGLIALLDSPTGQVGRYITAKAEAVAELARQNVQAQFRTRTGNLYNSIGVFPRETPDGLEAEVGTDGAPYGLVLEQGSGPHPISATRAFSLWSLRMDPNHPDPLLAGEEENGVPPEERLKRVSHPGFPAKPWLEPALRTVMLGA